MKTIHVPPLRWYERQLDAFFQPIMYVLSGTTRESPQRTHCWNNLKLSQRAVKHLLQFIMVYNTEVTATKRWFGWFPIFHMPIIGGWRVYVVIEPLVQGVTWHVGWVTADSIGVSRISVQGPLRVLIGDGDVYHFGLDAQGRQIPIHMIGRGRIGGDGPFAQLPLF